MPIPTFKLEAAFGYGPAAVTAGTAVWTDISAYLDMYVGVTWSRGRQRAINAIQPGQLTVALDNSTGAFTPGKTAVFIISQTPEEGVGIPLALSGFKEAFDDLP